MSHSDQLNNWIDAVPPGWKAEPVKDHDISGYIIRSPRELGIRTNTSVWEDSENLAERMLYLILAAILTDQERVKAADPEQKPPHANLEVMGNIQVDECGELQDYPCALVITFPSTDAIRSAIALGKCTFGFKE